MRSIAGAIALTLALEPAAFGLATEIIGNRPVGAQPGWPGGILAVVNDPCRVYQRWVNGNEQFYFRGDAEAVNRILKGFSRVELRRRDVLLRPDPGRTSTFEKKPIAFNVALDLPSGIYLAHAREVGEEAVFPTSPRLILYLGDGKVPLEKLGIPKGVRVRALGQSLGGLRRGLTHPDGYVRARAAGLLGDLGPDAAPAVPDLLRILREEKEAYLLRNAAGSLGRIGVKSREVNEALRRAARSEDEGVRAAAEGALRALVIPKDPHRAMRGKIAAFVARRRQGER